MGSRHQWILSPDLTVHGCLFLSCLVADLNHTVMDEQRTGWIVEDLLKQVERPLLGLFDDCVYIGWPLLDGGRFLLKSIVISTVLSVLSSRLFRLHHRTSCSTPCLYADSSPSLMSLITVTSSASCLSVSLWSTDRWMLGVQDLRDDGVKSWSEVYKQNSSICARAVMVLQDVVQHYVDIIHRTVGPAGKLQGIQQGTCDVLHLGHNHSLKRFHD